MLRLLDVYESVEGAGYLSPLLASLDVTGNSEAERGQVLQAARDLYGPECLYFWHDCGHDSNAPCSRSPAQ